MLLEKIIRKQRYKNQSWLIWPNRRFNFKANGFCIAVFGFALIGKIAGCNSSYWLCIVFPCSGMIQVRGKNCMADASLRKGKWANFY